MRRVVASHLFGGRRATAPEVAPAMGAVFQSESGLVYLGQAMLLIEDSEHVRHNQLINWPQSLGLHTQPPKGGLHNKFR
jgi:hypothetical protein